MRNTLKSLSIGCILLLSGWLLSTAINFDPAPSAKEYFFQHGTVETGAVNLVTSIYLGYRAFDTLGEPIVLMLAVTGVILLISKSSRA